MMRRGRSPSDSSITRVEFPRRFIAARTGIWDCTIRHNGVFESLEEVVDFYNKGGGDDPRKSPLLQSLDLTKQEMNDLLEFLKSLSGEEIIVEEPPEPPYAVLDE